MTAYDDLLHFTRKTGALEQIHGRLGWDQETMMPKGAAAQRAEESAALEEVLHARRIDPRVGEWLEAAKPYDAQSTSILRLIAKSYHRNLQIPTALATELARVKSLAQGEWAQARANEDVAAFLPRLREIVTLRREEAHVLAGDGNLYDALLEDYEPDAKSSEIKTIFDDMRPELVALREALLDASPAPRLSGHFPKDKQLALSDEIARAFGYDFNHGRIDQAVHPFSSGSGHDVRITTRVDEQEPLGCIYSTVHEVGHATYEQNIAADYLFTPLGRGTSMGVHESQSRLYENQLGRSEAFCDWLYGRMRDVFGDMGVSKARDFYRAINRVSSDYIRTEADEVHYNLHVMLRFDLERQLIDGTLEVTDLEEAWNTRFLSDFGLVVDKPSNGVLQDVHWAVGLFGYFPTYSLGNIYAGCLYEAMTSAVPNLENSLSQGEARPATEWLRDNLQKFGSLRPPRETIQEATGQTPSSKPLMAYLKMKFRDLYDL